ncbi:MAG TPA: methionyl-tRNA formyltransferase [Casimicrobiaceae bacterium]|nr:methionyl-tRNA formyltransferase [Casimicrobiaceae bacterium]
MATPLRVGFAGTPHFAARALDAIGAAGYTIPLVLTQPNRPHGRGLRQEPSPVLALAQSLGLPVMQPASLRDPAARAPLLAVALDVLVVAAYGLILPPEILAWPRHGCLNIHASKLPRWRGAAPIQRAIEAGDTQTGVTIMQMDAGLDTGPVITAVDVPIVPRETAGTLQDKLTHVGAQAIVETLGRLAQQGTLASVPQPAEGVTYAAKIGPADIAIDWRQPAPAIERRLRALDPTPGATTTLAGAPIKVRAGETVDDASHAAPGTVIAASDAGIVVVCGNAGALRITELQPAGGKRMPAAAFLRGRGVKPGVILG